VAASTDWCTPSGWLQRSSEFREVLEYDDLRSIVVMKFEPPMEPSLHESWRRLCSLWLDLPAHPNMLEAIEVSGDRGVLLRYSAIDWPHQPVRIDGGRAATRKLATWGAQLTEAFQVLVREVPEDERGWFSRPFAKVDIGGHVRCGFLPADPSDATAARSMPPEARQQWPACQEEAFVFLVGRLLADLSVPVASAPKTPITPIIERCLSSKPSKRYKTLADLGIALRSAGAPSVAVRRWYSLAAWSLNEAGGGWLAIDAPKAALSVFEDALRYENYTHLARQGRNAALTRLGRPTESNADWQTTALPVAAMEQVRSWAEAEPEAVRLETERAFADALNVYRSVRPEANNHGALFSALARCHLNLGEAGHAVDYAQRALAVEPRRTDALTIKVSGLISSRKAPEALKTADELLALIPNDGSAHYLRGKCLLALSRLVEARESFDRACALRPQLVEAMLLRREVDRCLKDLRKTVGHQEPMVLDVPGHLAELRGALVGGRTQDAIEMLQRPEYEADAVAQLILGGCLAFDGRFEESAEVYERASTLSGENRYPAMIGRACALLELGRPADALDVFDVVRRENPGNVDAFEGRARALEQLGRKGEAAEEFRRFVAAAGATSDLRVRSAQLWLAGA
jgi:tetratricopeptide (TPR) repeat protein